ncbi:MAG: hypothetical protein LBQ20_05735 [Rhodanobacter sp.]|jgi:hypothetical protein|nr:hypothetical protein [Rhodanobacter sp.]
MDAVRDQFLTDNPGSAHDAGGRQQDSGPHGSGTEKPEIYIPSKTPIPGSTKGGSYADMTFTDAQGRKVYVQTVDKGPVNGMSQREWDNANRISKDDPDAIVITVQKGAASASGSLNTAGM